jgi:hypothetical protein
LGLDAAANKRYGDDEAIPPVAFTPSAEPEYAEPATAAKPRIVQIYGTTNEDDSQCSTTYSGDQVTETYGTTNEDGSQYSTTNSGDRVTETYGTTNEDGAEQGNGFEQYNSIGGYASPGQIRPQAPVSYATPVEDGANFYEEPVSAGLSGYDGFGGDEV